MKRKLTMAEHDIFHYKNGKLVKGLHDILSGDVTGLRGDVTWLRGHVTGLRGHVTGLSGHVTGLSGDVTGLSGDVTDCEISDAEREKGVDVAELVLGK